MLYFWLGVSGPLFSGWSFAVMKFGMIQKIRLGTSSFASLSGSALGRIGWSAAIFGSGLSGFSWARTDIPIDSSVRNARHAAQFIERLFINYFFPLFLRNAAGTRPIVGKRSLPDNYGNPQRRPPGAVLEVNLALQALSLPIDLQVQIHFLPAVEGGNRARRRFFSTEFCTKLVVGIRVQSGEPVVPLGVAEVTDDHVRAEIFEKDNGVHHRFVRLVRDHTEHAAQTRFFLGLLLRILCRADSREKRQQRATP